MRSIVASITTAFLLSFVSSVSAADATSLTLQQAFEWARVQSESLKSRREDINQSKHRARAALAGALPNLDWQLTKTWQDTSGIPTFDTGDTGGADFIDEAPLESKFSLKQPLFSGLREFSSYKGFKRQMARDELRLERETAELYSATAEIFYMIISDQVDLNNTRAVLNLAEDRLVELRKNLRLGKSRESEVYSAQAQAASLRAQVRAIAGRINSGKAELAFLTGHEIGPEVVLVDGVAEPLSVGPVEDYLSKVAMRSDVRAQRENVAAEKLRVRYEKGSYWPSMDVTGNYYTDRPSFYEDINWDVVFFLRVPIYQGGRVGANVDAALAQYRQAALTLEMVERTARKDVARIHNDLATALDEIRDLEEAYEASRKSYDFQRKEYGLGLVTNLEVIEALNTLQAQKKAWDEARVAAKLLLIRLRVAVEEQPL